MTGSALQLKGQEAYGVAVLPSGSESNIEALMEHMEVLKNCLNVFCANFEYKLTLAK